jgi:methionine-gamma-lyase
MDVNKMKFTTKTIHAGQKPCPVTGSHVSPIYQTTTYVLKNIEEAIRLNQNQELGFTYTRFGSPTAAELENKMALLEKGEAALSVGSGMAAISVALLNALKAGDHLIAGDVIYGCTFALIKKVLTNYGVEVSLVDTTNLEDVEKAIKPNTKAIYVETPANPLLKITDIKGAAEIAHKIGAKLIVDSTFASPYLQNPLELGADVVVHSATKYLSGHGNVVAGIIVSDKGFIRRARMPYLQCFGAVISPFDAWLLMQGMKTLGVRMQRHCENGQKVAEFLEKHPQVEKVYYPGLPSHPNHELAKKQMRAFGGMMSFDVKGGFEAGKTLMNSVQLISLATSLGTVDSLIQHSPSMSHFDMSKEERMRVGIKDGQVRLSVGIEDVEDIIADLDQALNKVAKEFN